MSENIIEGRLKRRAACLTVVVNGKRRTQSGFGPATGDRMSAVYGRGLMWTDPGVVSLDHKSPRPLDYDTVRNRSGQWFLAFHRESDDSYRFVTDFMGYYRLYYSCYRRGDEQVVIVADNQTSLVAELRRLGRTVSLDWPVAASHLLSSHTMMQSS